MLNPANRLQRKSRLTACAVVIALYAVSLELWFPTVVCAEDSVRCDPTKVIGSETCIKCHANEFAVWKQTPHFATFDSLHRSPEAKQIALRMGIRGSIKRSGMCIDCHYTPQTSGDKVKAISGVSCESCHGPAAEWVNVHNDYGGLGVSRKQESEGHKLQRIATSIQLGMRNPRNPYLLARSCLGCHTVPDEQLVNKGGHVAGSETFELVSWSQGMIRHNFIRSEGQSNERSTSDRLRVLYLCGLIADLEFSVRAIAKATEQGVYGQTVASRSARVAVKLYQLQQEIRQPLLEEILRAYAGAELKTNNRQQLNAIANTIQIAGQQLAAQIDGSRLGFLDSEIPEPGQYK